MARRLYPYGTEAVTPCSRGCNGLRMMLRQADELIAAMASTTAPALRQVASRSRPMLACYPGGSARYLTHLDNPGGAQANDRLLTLLLYLNASWCEADGGMLRLHRADGARVDVEPLLDRCVLFWSDHRTPHEVLPAQRARWAVSVWYCHGEQPAAAAAAAAAAGAEGAVVDAADCGGGDGGVTVSEGSFGSSTEEVESFLLAMLALKGGGAAGVAPTRPKGEHFNENIRSW